MRCTWLLFFVFYLHSVGAVFHENLLQNFESAKEDGLVSEACQTALDLYLENVNITGSWAMLMLDATSKIPVGIFSLNLGEMGQFSQCLATESQDGLIKARYCLGSLSLDNIFGTFGNSQMNDLHRQALRIKEAARIATLQARENDNANDNQGTIVSGIPWAICLPSDCTNEDVGAVFNLLSLTLVDCQVKEDLSPPLTTGAIVTIVVLSIFAVLMVTSTALDLYCKFTHKESPHILLLAFSVYSNGQKLFRVSKNSNEMSCVNGVRFLSMLWVIIGHVYSVHISTPIFNYMDIVRWTDALRSMIIINGTLAVDSFFLLAGMLVVYSYMKAKHHGVKFNIFMFYIHRYLRLTPALAAAMLVSTTLLRYTGSGPMWNVALTAQEDDCQKYWWAGLLYVQNYVNADGHFCLGHSWYLNIDMQLYVIAPFILIPLWKYPKVGLSLIAAGVITFIIVPFTVAYITEIPALVTNFHPRASPLDYTIKYYVKTHTRAAPWFIGLFLGHVLAKIKFQDEYKRIRLNIITVIGMWSICLAVMLSCIYGGHSTLRDPDYNIWENSFYIGFVRPAWSVCLAWVILACEIGYGGPINWFLSLPVYQVLGRFTYSVYLVHYPLITAILCYKVKTGVYFDELNMAYSFWGITMFSFGLGIIWVLAFESPVVVLEKVLFGGGKKNNKQQTDEHNKGVTA